MSGSNGWTVRIKSAGRNINYFSYADDTTLVAESEEELKPLESRSEESEESEEELNRWNQECWEKYQ